MLISNVITKLSYVCVIMCLTLDWPWKLNLPLSQPRQQKPLQHSSSTPAGKAKATITSPHGWELCRISACSVDIMVYTALIARYRISGKKTYCILTLQKKKKSQEGMKIMSPNCFVPLTQEMTRSDTHMKLFIALDRQWIIMRPKLPASRLLTEAPSSNFCLLSMTALSSLQSVGQYKKKKKKIKQKAETNPTWWIIIVRKICVISGTFFHSESRLICKCS